MMRTEALLQYDQVVRCGALRRGSLKLVWNGDCGNDPRLFGAWDQFPYPVSSSADGTNNNNDDDDNNDEWLLFDLSTDPLERRDLSAEQPEKAESMRLALEAHGRNAADALAFVTPGDDAASPALHSGTWVSWLGD